VQLEILAMKKKTAMLGAWSAISLLGLSAFAWSRGPAPEYKGSRASEVWAIVQEGEYNELPRFKVTAGSFFGFLQDRLEAASARTLVDGNDTLPTFRKLLHANGICLKGTWNITEPSPFTGYFQEGSQAVIIARASAALSEVNQGENRSLGLAGKLYPTVDDNHQEPLKTANFFVIDDLGGTYIPHFRDAPMTNDISSISFGLDNAPNALVAAAAGRALQAAEKAAGGKDAFIRQLYPVSELGETNKTLAITPRWIKIQGQTGSRENFRDFRDELRVENHGGVLNFDIFVSSEGERGQAKVWQKIGYIEFTESVASEGCDNRLHFAHPQWREDLTFNR
jgi:hypothetical protein